MVQSQCGRTLVPEEGQKHDDCVRRLSVGTVVNSADVGPMHVRLGIPKNEKVIEHEN
ncbi:hypothetical protein ACOJUR_10760 [Alicyclobacillus tolerans]|uniref:hypothetical protein n=1 Tax=Alicyclobacillus tolerans TaxID=90970 RepID=UPI003B819982